MNKFLSLLGFDPAKHSVRVEMMAGLTTFLTMSYILAVNPLILCDAGMDKGAVFSATVIAAAIATMVMAFYAKMPFALASGMGINAFFAYTLVIVMGYSWQQALAAVFIEGIVFIFLTIFKVREAIVNAIPLNLRYSISVGIGLFIAFIGLKNGGLVVSSEATMTSLGAWTPTTLIAAGGILLGAVLLALKVKGALFYTIIIMTIIGIPFGVTKIPEGFTLVSMPHSIEPVAFHIDFSRFISLDVEYYIVVFTLLFMDLFDTIGTLIGAATGAGMADKKTGRIHHLNKALMADAVGTTVGAICGTSTVTTYVESTTGILEGGRTGSDFIDHGDAFLGRALLLAGVPDDSRCCHDECPLPGRCHDVAFHRPYRLCRFHRGDALFCHDADDALYGEYLRGHRAWYALLCDQLRSALAGIRNSLMSCISFRHSLC